MLFPQRCDTNDKLKGYVVKMVEIGNSKLVLQVRMWVLLFIIQPWGLFCTLHFLVYILDGRNVHDVVISSLPFYLSSVLYKLCNCK